VEKDLNNLSKQELIALLEQKEKALFLAQNQQQETDSKIQQLTQDKEGLIEQTKELTQDKEYLKLELDYFKRLLFGQKREQFLANNGQMVLPFESTSGQEEEIQEKVEIKRKKVKNKERQSHPGRHQFPEHLPVEEIEIHPAGDLSEMEVIGKEITEELDCKPLSFFIKRYIRYKYAPKNKQTTPIIGELPSRVIDKGIPSVNLLTLILTNKYIDHLPLYRQKQQFAREQIKIPNSTINHWVQKGLDRLSILYELLREDLKKCGYLQVDESPIKVLDKDKKGACHQGYYWVYHAPIEGLVLFEFHSTRGFDATKNILQKDFKGYLQSDGYSVYEKIAQRKEITHIPCLAHIRRKFFDAQNNHQEFAEKALTFIQEIYQWDRQAKELEGDQKHDFKLDHILPLFQEIGKWMYENYPKVLPKSAIGKAFSYTMNRWGNMYGYLLDHHLHLDNNLVENAIRPIALGRKNYLFAGLYDAAQKAAMIYSFFAICKKHEVNPNQWLKFALENINEYSIQNLRDLYPQNFKKKQSES